MINETKVRNTVNELETNFQYLHYNTIVTYCEISKLNKQETIEVYNLVEYLIDYKEQPKLTQEQEHEIQQEFEQELKQEYEQELQEQSYRNDKEQHFFEEYKNNNI